MNIATALVDKLVTELFNVMYSNSNSPAVTIALNDSTRHLEEYFPDPGKMDSERFCVFNLSSSAITNFKVSSGFVSFDARFNGLSKLICFSVSSIVFVTPYYRTDPKDMTLEMRVYAGTVNAIAIQYRMVLIEIEGTTKSQPDPTPPTGGSDSKVVPLSKSTKPSLKIVK